MTKSQRQCGSCSLCCKVMNVPEIGKPNHEWCQHAKPGCGGCGIYRSRPDVCRDFHCVWLIDEGIADHWYPLKSKIVIHAIQEKGHDYVAFIVDPSYPTRWREEPWFTDIKQMAKAGINGRTGRKWTTLVVVGEKKIPIINSERLLREAPLMAMGQERRYGAR